VNSSKLLLQIDSVLELATSAKVSELLPRVYTIAKLADDESLEKWSLLETSGYYDTNPALTDEVRVPEYRKVPGFYQDTLGRQLKIDDPDLFKTINNYHLRESVAEMEAIAEKDGMLNFRNPYVMQKLQEMFHVQVDEFHFKSKSVIPIINEIRSQIIAKLIRLRKELSERSIAVGVNPDTPRDLIHLHPIVQKTAGELYKNGHYRQAILDTYIALVDAVKVKSTRYDIDNSPLMQAVFSAKRPVLKVSNDQDEQMGFMWLFSGAVMAIRNPKAHKLIEQKDTQRTIEWLSFASVLLRVLDEAELIKESL
jgi:uncharacterized protein (TIGR02391 family)